LSEELTTSTFLRSKLQAQIGTLAAQIKDIQKMKIEQFLSMNDDSDEESFVPDSPSFSGYVGATFIDQTLSGLKILLLQSDLPFSFNTSVFPYNTRFVLETQQHQI